MTDYPITAVDAWEVLDSRGDPTVRVHVETTTGSGTFSVPAGASTGRYEAVERRDGGSRYGGRGVTGAVMAIEAELRPVVIDRSVTAQGAIDELLVETDGTATLERLGANAVLGVSGAIARAGADTIGVPLFRYLAPDSLGRLPLPMINLVSGGAHAPGGLAIQDILAVPVGAATYPAAIEMVWSVRAALQRLLLADGHRPLVADEGGFAPPLSNAEAGFELVITAIRTAGFEPGVDIALGVDVAANQCFTGTDYDLAGSTPLSPDAMVDRIIDWCTTYPLVSVEDPLYEDDWDRWCRLRAALPDVQLVGDDLLVTDRGRLERAIELDAVSAVLVKPNQTGTISRTIDVIRTAQAANIAPIVSARSGETSDATIADLAVAMDAGQLKVGSLARSERLAKWNRLLDVAARTDCTFAGADALGS